ncbi:protein of unknown function [Legionella fallonii LLAP-10]|uniref:Uncharacterized protein n=1 Tax=Legionella fallonii LLAP-10 TaxID=1212491 RepID=A0A098G222_9GAMM|nr:protein of unknown function [Legionella fallonii LLAP-10]
MTRLWGLDELLIIVYFTVVVPVEVTDALGGNLVSGTKLHTEIPACAAAAKQNAFKPMLNWRIKCTNFMMHLCDIGDMNDEK